VDGGLPKTALPVARVPDSRDAVTISIAVTTWSGRFSRLQILCGYPRVLGTERTIDVKLHLRKRHHLRLKITSTTNECRGDGREPDPSHMEGCDMPRGVLAPMTLFTVNGSTG
jgi:hypothetical protein